MVNALVIPQMEAQCREKNSQLSLHHLLSIVCFFNSISVNLGNLEPWKLGSPLHKGKHNTNHVAQHKISYYLVRAKDWNL